MTDKRIPLHADSALNEEWLASKGYTVGENVWLNSIRDGSGRFDGYAFVPTPREFVIARTVREAEITIKLMSHMTLAFKALKTIREAGHNTTDWATWAQKWAAHAMNPEFFKDAPPQDAPEERGHQ